MQKKAQSTVPFLHEVEKDSDLICAAGFMWHYPRQL